MTPGTTRTFSMQKKPSIQSMEESDKCSIKQEKGLGISNGLRSGGSNERLRAIGGRCISNWVLTATGSSGAYRPFPSNTTGIVFARMYKFSSKDLRWMYK